jgi:hypothetical protein
VRGRTCRLAFSPGMAAVGYRRIRRRELTQHGSRESARTSSIGACSASAAQLGSVDPIGMRRRHRPVPSAAIGLKVNASLAKQAALVSRWTQLALHIEVLAVDPSAVTFTNATPTCQLLPARPAPSPPRAPGSAATPPSTERRDASPCLTNPVNRDIKSTRFGARCSGTVPALNQVFTSS